MAVQLLIVGASARGAAQAATRAGLRVIGADLFADSDMAALGPAWKVQRYPGEFLKVIDGLNGIPWMYTGGLENFPRLVDRMAQHGPLWGNDGTVLRQVRSPQFLQQIIADQPEAKSCSLHFPCTLSRQDSEELQSDDKQWLYKPRRGSGGLGVQPAQNISTKQRSGHLQEMLAGQVHSVTFLSAAGDCLLLGVTRQFCAKDFATENGPVATTNPFAYAGNLGPCEISAEVHASLSQLGKQLTEQTGLTGLWGADFVVQKNRWSLLEVNPRYTASMEIIEEGLSLPLMLWHRAAFERKTLPSLPSKSLARGIPFVAKGVAYARHDVNITPTFLSKLTAQFPAERPATGIYDWPSIADIPTPQQQILTAQPICTVFIRAASTKLAESQLRRAIKDVQKIAKQHEARSSSATDFAPEA